ncbi:MAG TPA: FtsX-like permease family protein, partial [Myxococcales bacterium]|nr:FtsX-like permease family protein [Myxococcales bacterium]
TFTTFLLVMMVGLTHGIRTTILETATILMSGHLNVGGFYKVTAGQSAPVVTNAEEVVALVRREVPEVEAVALRGRGYANLVSPTSSIQMGVGGIDVEKEPRFRQVVKVLDGSMDEMTKPNTLMLFKDQADKLEVKAGDMVTLSAPTLRGVSNTVDVRVAVVAQNLGLLSAFNVYVPNPTLRGLYQLNDQAAGVVQLYIRDVGKVREVQARLRKVLEGGGHTLMDADPQAFWFKFEKVNREAWTGQKLDVTSWEDELSFLDWMLSGLTALSIVLIGLLLLVVCVGLMNTLWIAIRERTREIGTLRAIGMQRRRVMVMFLLEALMLSLGGVAVGTAVALLAQLGLNAAHIHVPLAMQFVLMRDTLTFNANPSTVALGIAIIVVATMLVSVIPSFLAARLRPVTAMHHIG